MNECHLALTITHIREESKGLRRVSGLAKVTLFSISHASTLIQDLTSFLALGLTRWSPILFQKGHGHPGLKPLQTASSERTDSREWQGGGSKPEETWVVSRNCCGQASEPESLGRERRCPDTASEPQPTRDWETLSRGPLALPVFLWEAVLLLSKHQGLNSVSSFHPLLHSQAHMVPSRPSFEPVPRHPLSRSRLTGLTFTSGAVFYGWPSQRCYHFPLLEMAELSPLLSNFPHLYQGVWLGEQT